MSVVGTSLHPECVGPTSISEHSGRWQTGLGGGGDAIDPEQNRRGSRITAHAGS